MIDSAEVHGPTWWALLRERLAACWWRLLVAQTLFALAGSGMVMLSVTVVRHWSPVVSQVLILVVGGLLAAWGWSAKLRILDGDRGIVSALRPDPRRVTRLWPWLVALNLTEVLGLLYYVDKDVFGDVNFSPTAHVLRLLSLYLVFAAALLPMVVVLEGSGFRRALLLAHSGWKTVLRLLAIVGLAAAVSEAIRHATLPLVWDYPPSSFLRYAQAVTFLEGVLQGLLTAVLLYVTYRLSPLVSDAGRAASRTAAAVSARRRFDLFGLVGGACVLAATASLWVLPSGPDQLPSPRLSAQAETSVPAGHVPSERLCALMNNPGILAKLSLAKVDAMTTRFDPDPQNRYQHSCMLVSVQDQVHFELSADYGNPATDHTPTIDRLSRALKTAKRITVLGHPALWQQEALIPGTLTTDLYVAWSSDDTSGFIHIEVNDSHYKELRREADLVSIAETILPQITGWIP